MAKEISARNVSKFDGVNFQSWTFQMRALFLAHGILDVVDGTRERPEENLRMAEDQGQRKGNVSHLVNNGARAAREPLDV